MHPIVQAGKSLDSSEESGRNLKIYKYSVHSSMPSPWRELRHEQWRGLTTQAESPGQWWLLFAGLEREGDDDDVYTRVQSLVPQQLLCLYPTELDFKLLSLEQGESIQRRWDASCASSIIRAIAGAAESGHRIELALPVHPGHPGAKFVLGIDVSRIMPEDERDEPEETPAELLLMLVTNEWHDAPLRSKTLKLLMRIIDPVLENWDAVYDNGLDTRYAVMITEARLMQIIAAVALEDSPLDYEQVRVPGDRGEPGTGFSHYLPQSALVDAYVYGEELRGLCGQWFVPTKDGTSMPTCPACHEKYSKLPA
ncbi:DUF3039 domain-containing protein [Arthrobacter sp. YAF34]|uniref:DUF3039 domain-containing protein n=1 Tax=Arthrobacter sp. YAF34 TaxID=3233083 RepID=UPI003F91C018